MDSLLTKLALVYPKSLLNEFYTVFGDVTTTKLLSVFAGMTLKIPSSREVQKARRDLVIYETLQKATSKEEFRIIRKTLQAKHGLSKAKIKEIHKYMQKLHKAGKELQDADKAVSQHRKKKVKVKKRKKWLR